MTVIHLRRTTKKDSCAKSSSATMSRIQTMQPATNCEVEGDFFEYGTIPSTDAAIDALDRECINYLSDTDTELKMLQRYSRIRKVFISSTELYHRLHQLNDCSAQLDRSKCHAATIWVTRYLRNFRYWKQTTVCFRTEGFYWHYYLCFYLMALILQSIFDAHCMRGCLYYCACIFCYCVFSFNLGVCWDFSKVSAKYQESRYF